MIIRFSFLERLLIVLFDKLILYPLNNKTSDDDLKLYSVIIRSVKCFIQDALSI